MFVLETNPKLKIGTPIMGRRVELSREEELSWRIRKEWEKGRSRPALTAGERRKRR